MTEEMLWHANAAGLCVQRALRWDRNRQHPWRSGASSALLGVCVAGVFGVLFSAFLEGWVLSGVAAFILLLVAVVYVGLHVRDARATPRISDGCVINVGEYWYGPKPTSARYACDPEVEVLPPGEHEITVGDGRIVWVWPNGRVWGHAYGWWTRTIIAGDFLIATRAEEGVQEYICFQVPLSVIGDASDVERLQTLLTVRQPAAVEDVQVRSGQPSIAARVDDV